MEDALAIPLVALVEPCEGAALRVLMTLEAAGYRTTWHHTAADLLADALNSAPDVVILAGTHPAHFNQWHGAQALRELDAAVIMATADAAARCEVHTTPRGAAFVDSVHLPYDPVELLRAVQRAIHDYPANLRGPIASHRALGVAREGWRGALLHLWWHAHDPAHETTTH